MNIDKMRQALELIATPMRPDGTWNRDREACRQLAAEALVHSDERLSTIHELSSVILDINNLGADWKTPELFARMMAALANANAILAAAQEQKP